MDKLWTKRKPPIPLSLDKLPETGSLDVFILYLKKPDLNDFFANQDVNNSEGLIKDQRIWSIAECVQTMALSIKALYGRLQVTMCFILEKMYALFHCFF